MERKKEAVPDNSFLNVDIGVNDAVIVDHFTISDNDAVL